MGSFFAGTESWPLITESRYFLRYDKATVFIFG